MIDTLSYFGQFIPWLPALVAGFSWRVLNARCRWFAALMCFVAFNSMVAFIWLSQGHHNTMPFFHAYILIETLMMLRVFHLMLGPSISRVLLVSIGTLFTVGWMLNVLSGDGILGLPTWIRAGEALVLIPLAVCYFMKMLRERVVRNPTRTFDFWVATGVLIYFSGNLLLFGFSQTVLNLSGKPYLIIWEIHGILAILLYLIYTVAILWGRKNPTSS